MHLTRKSIPIARGDAVGSRACFRERKAPPCSRPSTTSATLRRARSASTQPARTGWRRRARRLHRAARRRASGRVCRRPLRAAEMADRLHRLGRRRDRAAPSRASIFVDGRYTLQVRDQVDLDVFAIESLVDNPPPDWIKANLGKGARHRLRSVAAHDRRGQGAEGGGRGGRRDAGAARQQPDRRDLAGPARRRRWRRSKSIRSNFAGELAKDKLARLAGAIAKARRDACRADRPVLDRLGLQHPRRRRAAHAAGARLRDSRRRRPAPAVHRQAQAADRDGGLSHPACRLAARRPRSRPRSRRLPRPARRSRSTRCSRPKSCACWSRTMAARSSAADPARLPRATKNQRRDRRRPRRPPPRRRGGGEASVLARRASSPARSTRSRS